MKTRIKRFETGFTMAPNQLITDKRVKAVAFRLWCLLNSKPEGWVFVPDVIQKELGVSEDTFYSIYEQATSGPFGFLMIDMHPKKEHPSPYRRGLDTFLRILRRWII